MRKFAECWTDFEFVQQVVAQISWRTNIMLIDKLKKRKSRVIESGYVNMIIMSSRRAANFIAMALLGGFFVISFFNNLKANINISSYFTPFRWFFILRLFDSNSFGILFLALFAVAAVFVAALTLSARRDVGEGIIPHRTGKADAPDYLRNVWALSLRMHRGVLFSWSVFALFIGLQLFWEIGILPETAFLLSPFGHVYPTRPQTALTFVILTIVALVLYMIGFMGFKKRDIQQ